MVSKPIRDLISKEDDKNLKEQQKFFRRLPGDNWPQEKVHDHFCAPMGVVDFSVDYLNSTKPNPLKTLRLGGRIRTETSQVNPGWVRTELYEFLTGKHIEGHLKHDDFFTERRRLKFMKDLVGITRQLYKQKLAHCDLSLMHIMVVKRESEEITTANFTEDNDFTLRYFDFERISTTMRGQQKKGQLWQLLGLMATVCGWPNKTKKRIPRYDVSSKVCYERKLWVTAEQFESRFLGDLQKCPFVRPLNWTSRMLEDTEYAYEQLASLVGLDAN